jgi:hypothetical protein
VLEHHQLALDQPARPVAVYVSSVPPDQQILLTNPDSRSMATSGRGSGVVGFNVQTAVDTENHLIVTGSLGRKPPLVVVLHGATQTAADYAHGSGWLTLADRHGFALLFPQQRRSNNPFTCFHWYRRRDAKRGRGGLAIGAPYTMGDRKLRNQPGSLQMFT